MAKGTHSPDRVTLPVSAMIGTELPKVKLKKNISSPISPPQPAGAASALGDSLMFYKILTRIQSQVPEGCGWLTVRTLLGKPFVEWGGVVSQQVYLRGEISLLKLQGESPIDENEAMKGREPEFGGSLH